MLMLHVLKRFKASLADLTAVYQMHIRPVLEYASPLKQKIKRIHVDVVCAKAIQGLGC